jgi:hypothetical protein
VARRAGIVADCSSAPAPGGRGSTRTHTQLAGPPAACRHNPVGNSAQHAGHCDVDSHCGATKVRRLLTCATTPTQRRYNMQHMRASVAATIQRNICAAAGGGAGPPHCGARGAAHPPTDEGPQAAGALYRLQLCTVVRADRGVIQCAYVGPVRSPRCHGECASQKNTRVPMREVIC